MCRQTGQVQMVELTTSTDRVGPYLPSQNQIGVSLSFSRAAGRLEKRCCRCCPSGNRDSGISTTPRTAPRNTSRPTTLGTHHAATIYAHMSPLSLTRTQVRLNVQHLSPKFSSTRLSARSYSMVDRYINKYVSSLPVPRDVVQEKPR